MLTKYIHNKDRRLLIITLSILLGLSLCIGFAPLNVYAENSVASDNGQSESSPLITLVYRGEKTDLSQAYLKRTDTEEDIIYPLTAVDNGAAIPAGTYSIYIPDTETGADIMIQGAEFEVKENIPPLAAEYFCIRFTEIDGTTLLSKQFVSAGGSFSVPQLPAYDGYDWIGWANAPGGEVVNLPLEVHADYTFYGIWEAASAPIDDPKPTGDSEPIDDPEPTGDSEPEENPIPAPDPISHLHTYEWKFDDAVHWQECTSTEGICDAKTIELAEHLFDKGTITKEATKSEEGEQVFKCSICEYTKTETIAMLPHEHIYTWKSNNKEHWQECTSAEGICDMKEIAWAAHIFDNGIVTKEATEDTEGEKVLKCETCGYTKKEIIPKLPHIHKYGNEWKSDETSHWHECLCGGRNETAPHTASDWITDTKPTVSAEGSRHKECTACKNILQTETIPKLTPPKITAGVGQIFQPGSSNGITVTCSGSLENLTGVYVNNELVHPSNYTVTSGSTILTLHPAYLESLAGGTHTIKLAYSDGTSAETQFTIQKTTAVKTGDAENYIPLIILLILSGCVLIITLTAERFY